MTELLDIYDDNGRPIGVKARAAVHRDGDWHRVFHCWVAYRGADGRGYLVIQKRGADKDLFPNLYDTTVGGHYASGESAPDGVREIHEELGLNVRFEDLIPLGVRLDAARYGDLIDREVADVFLYICDTPIADYPFDRDELSGLAALAIDDGLALCSGERDTISAQAVLVQPDKSLLETTVTLSLADFTPSTDAYLYKMCILVRRCLAGESHLVI